MENLLTKKQSGFLIPNTVFKLKSYIYFHLYKDISNYLIKCYRSTQLSYKVKGKAVLIGELPMGVLPFILDDQKRDSFLSCICVCPVAEVINPFHIHSLFDTSAVEAT